MPNLKLPSELILEALKNQKEGQWAVDRIVEEMIVILDDQHSQIQSLQKEVEELKKPVNKICGVRGCNDHFMHAHLTP